MSEPRRLAARLQAHGGRARRRAGASHLGRMEGAHPGGSLPRRCPREARLTPVSRQVAERLPRSCVSPGVEARNQLASSEPCPDGRDGDPATISACWVALVRLRPTFLRVPVGLKRAAFRAVITAFGAACASVPVPAQPDRRVQSCRIPPFSERHPRALWRSGAGKPGLALAPRERPRPAITAMRC